MEGERTSEETEMEERERWKKRARETERERERGLVFFFVTTVLEGYYTCRTSGGSSSLQSLPHLRHHRPGPTGITPL